MWRGVIFPRGSCQIPRDSGALPGVIEFLALIVVGRVARDPEEVHQIRALSSMNGRSEEVHQIRSLSPLNGRSPTTAHAAAAFRDVRRK